MVTSWFGLIYEKTGSLAPIFFFDGTLNSEILGDALLTDLYLLSSEKPEWFLQGGASPHYRTQA